MKTKKFAPIAIAFFWAFVMHTFVSYYFYGKQYKYESLFFISSSITVLYFILFSVSSGLFIIEPYEALKNEFKEQKKDFNWWWDIYLAGWVLIVIGGLEMLGTNYFDRSYYYLPKIGNCFIDYVLFFFLIKGVFLIPSYLVKKENKEDTNNFFQLVFLELIIIALFFLFLWALGQVVVGLEHRF